MLLIVRDDVSRYQIECPDHCEIRPNDHGTDYLIVPDPDDPAGIPYWLFDEILIEAARIGAFGLHLHAESPLDKSVSPPHPVR